MTLFSFNPVDLITPGESGIITTNYEEKFEKLKFSHSHGIWKMPNAVRQGDWYYEMIELGLN